MCRLIVDWCINRGPTEKSSKLPMNWPRKSTPKGKKEESSPLANKFINDRDALVYHLPVVVG